MTAQNNLGNVLYRLGERSGTARLEEAAKVYGDALEDPTRERVPFEWAALYGNQGLAMMLIADRTNDGALAEAAVQIQTAVERLRSGGQPQSAAHFEAQLPKAQAIRDRLKAN